MLATDSKRYYWLKMNTNFFDNHKLRSLSMFQNGREAQLLYVKLLVESISHNGELRNSKDIPYSDMMIAGFTYTPVEIVRDAISLLQQVGLISTLEDGTIKFHEMDQLVGSETGQTIRKNHASGRQVVESTTISGEKVVKPTIELKSIRVKEYKNSGGGGNTRACANDSNLLLGEYPDTFKVVKDYLLSQNLTLVDEDILFAKFLDLKKKNWVDGRKRPIKDWREFFTRMVQKQMGAAL